MEQLLCIRVVAHVRRSIVPTPDVTVSSRQGVPLYQFMRQPAVSQALRPFVHTFRCRLLALSRIVASYPTVILPCPAHWNVEKG